jgi:hypothetical protein
MRTALVITAVFVVTAALLFLAIAASIGANLVRLF